MINVTLRVIWATGMLVGLSSIAYPAICAFASLHADPDNQGKNNSFVSEYYS